MYFDIRWKQRFQNFEKALGKLNTAVKEIQNDNYKNEILQAGLIQIFEFTFELAWKTLKDYLENEGFDVPTPKKTLRQAYQSGIIEDGALWMKALDDRNKTSHLYNELIAKEAAVDIVEKYFPIIKTLFKKLKDEL
jgi:nucleotidyltransferase substrate binding protein (TIGR01987 family)